ncbi:hypothetical protein LIER_09754 [Lithospermum erythrorhizon]|uniref:Reverse transcriptase domain-containing protein n=1 Tax=Lithospermum erythrorhizon TaxID=34254 RepID=A0AAV3PJU5_LITER
MCVEVGVTHIAFDDDLMLFSRGDISLLGILMDCLSHLERCSGPAVSPAKPDEGGLGLKDIPTWNSALLACALWSLHSDAEFLWVRWVHGHYLNGVSIWDYVKRRRDFLLMRSLCDLRDTLVVAYGGRDEAIAGLEGCCVGEN